jgi:hypothetical protein
VSELSKGLAKWRLALVAVAAVVFLAAAWSWASVRGLPEQLRETKAGPWLQHRVTADYTIGLNKGALYPNGAQVRPGQTSVPMKLFAWASMTISDEITYAGGDITAGHYWVDIRVRAGDLWHKDYAVLAKRNIAPDNPTIQASFTLPLAKIISDVGRIEREIGMASPTGKYEVQTRLHTSVAFKATSETVHEYTPVFTFTLATSGLILEAPKELVKTERLASDLQIDVPNTRHFFGEERPVEEIKRTTTTVLMLASVLLVSMLGLSAGLARTLPQDPGRRYRDRLVKVTEIGGARAEISVRVSGLKELARIADEAQAAIMELAAEAKAIPPEFDREPTPELMGRRFFLVAGGTLYYVV